MWTRAHGRFAVMQTIGVRQLGRVLGLGCMSAAVLPNVLEPKPGPHHAAPATNVSTWHHGERHNRRANLLFAVINPSMPYWESGFPLGVSHRARGGLYVRVRHAVRR